ncbi:MAG: GatB/YqeY domain-containing protein [Acidihalobacter sp.]
MSDASPLKTRIAEDVKAAMRAGARERLGTLRGIMAALKQIEVDTREPLDDAGTIAVLDKLAKQRRESIEQFGKAGRNDLVTREASELEIIQEFLPPPLDESAIETLLREAIAETGAVGMKDMGKVMAKLRPELQGRADMTAVSAQLKARLAG